MPSLTSIRRPNPLWASVVLLVVVSGAVLSSQGGGRQDAARRVRIGGTRGVGVIHQVRVEPYGRAAAEHAYFDDDELDSVDHGNVGPLSPQHRVPVFLPAAAAHSEPAASSRLAVGIPAHRLFSADSVGAPSGRAPPLA